MVPGRKVYDPLSNKWSTGYWVPVYGRNGDIKCYVPLWSDYTKVHKKELRKEYAEQS